MKKTYPVLLYTDPTAATRQTVTGWVGANGRWWGEDEHMARWDSCTHVICACGVPVEKSYTMCESCRCANEIRAWEALPLVEWDGDTPLCIHDSDQFFFDAESFYDWCGDNELKPELVRLVECVPSYLSEVDVDYWYDDLNEDGELPDSIQVALDALNQAIRDQNKKVPVCWWPGKRRVILKGAT